MKQFENEPKTYVRSPVSRDVGAQVDFYGQPDIEAIERLIEILILIRNGWVGAE